MIPLSNLTHSYQAYKKEIKAAIECVLESGIYLYGREVELFEQAFSKETGIAHTVAVDTGTDALAIALAIAKRMTGGSWVLMPAFAPYPLLVAAKMANMSVLLADVDEMGSLCAQSATEVCETWAERLGLAAIVGIHMYGCRSYDDNGWHRLANEYGALLIEDCSHAHGLKPSVGQTGDIAVWSFYPTKPLGAIGDGGALTTYRSDIATLARSYAAMGMNNCLGTESFMLNSRMDEIQASVLRTKLGFLEQEIEFRQAIAKIYNAAFRAHQHISYLTDISEDCAWYEYPIFVCPKIRDWLKLALEDYRVQTAIHYPYLLNQHPGYQVANHQWQFPKATSLRLSELSLPMWPYMTTGITTRVAEDVITSMEIAGYGCK